MAIVIGEITMRHLATIILAGCLLAAAPVEGAQAEGEDDLKGATTRESSGKEDAVEPREDKEIWGMIFNCVHPGMIHAEYAPGAIRALKAMDQQRVLSAFAYYLADESKRHYALRFIRWHYPEPALVPLVADSIRRSSGAMLLEAVKAAKAVPDERLLGPLIEHALMDDYGGTRTVVTPMGGERASFSLFAEVTKVLDKITRGRTSIRPVSSSELRAADAEKKKKELRAKWRDWWAKVKASKAAAELERAKSVTYLDQVWAPCGPDFNVRAVSDAKGERYEVLDNTGKAVFAKAAKLDDPSQRIGWSGGSPYLTRKAHKPERLLITLLGDKGQDLRTVSAEPIAGSVHIAPAANLLILNGPRWWAEGEAILDQRLRAYSLDTGESVQGDLPDKATPAWKLLTRPEWKQVWLVKGPFHGIPHMPTAIAFDSKLQKRVERQIAGAEYELQCACAGKDKIFGVVSSSEEMKVFRIDVASGELTSASLGKPIGIWVAGQIVGDKFVIWTRDRIIVCDGEKLTADQTITPPVAPGYRLEYTTCAVRGDECVAIVYNDEYHKGPARVLIYSKGGKLLSDIALRAGRIEQMKFAAGGSQLLVFARKYTARVELPRGLLQAGAPGSSPSGAASKER
ncbi:MAG: hypothetical protein ACYTF6_04090 [Planctomycetota bacterium]|jgi:hypothetical protein